MPGHREYSKSIASRRQRPVLADGTPRTLPWLMILRAGDGWHQLRYVDEGGPRRTNRPPGVDHLELCIVMAGDPRRADLDDPTHRREKVRRNPVRIDHDRANAGRQAIYFGRWVSDQGIAGPWSVPVGMTVAVVESSEGRAGDPNRLNTFGSSQEKPAPKEE